jgi:Bacterial SH3 domain
MTADVIPPRQVSLAGRAAKVGTRGSWVVSCTSIPHVSASSAEGGAGDARAPFYDQLMSMVHATALENRCAPQDLEIDAAPLAASHPWRIGRLITCAAGLIVAVAVGHAIVGSAMRQWGRPAADGLPDKAPHVAVAGTAAVDKPIERSPLTAEPVSPESTGIKDKQTAEGDLETGTVLAAKPDGPAANADMGPPIESPGLETEKDSPAGAPDGAKAIRTEVVTPAEEPPAADASLSPAPTIVTGSIGKDPGKIRIGYITSDVNMRAGPSNGQPVLATIARDSAVEVIGCRAWCEVIASGHRGWIYKGFLAVSDVSDAR